MTRNPHEFGRALKRANRIIAACEEKPVSVWHDELGYRIGREGGGAIEYWERGNVPPDNQTVKLLTEELTKKMLTTRRALDSLPDLERFLKSADHPGAKETAQDIWQRVSGTPPPLDRDQENPLLEPHSFVSGGPIFNPSQFFGRKEELDTIFNGLKKTPFRHTAIWGRWRSGKTSLLYYIKNIHQAQISNLRPGQKRDWLSQSSHYRWVWINFSNPRMRQREVILRQLLKGFEMPIPDVCNMSNFEEIVVEQKLQYPTVVLMDSIRIGMDVDELDMKFWGFLRHIAQSESVKGHLSFLITSQNPIEIEKRESGRDSPFFNLFNSTELGPLSEEESDELIASSPKPISYEDKIWILEQSGRWPSLMQILCHEKLISLEKKDNNEDWKENSLRQIAIIKKGWQE